MARIFPGLYGNIIGSVGGHTFSKNRSGPYVKIKAQPTNPNSAAQALVRGYMSTAVANWSNVLTGDEAKAWDHAAELHKRSKYGLGYTLSGLNLYVAHFIQMMKAGETPITEPTVFNGACENTIPTIGIEAIVGELEVTAWDAVDTNLRLIVQATNAVPLTTSYKKGAFKGYYSWTTITAWPQPITVVYPGSGEGYRVFTQSSAFDVRGAISSKIGSFADGLMV